MSLAGPTDNRPSKNQRREAAREKAKLLREAQRKKDRRNRFLIQGGVVLGIIAIVAVVALILVNTLKPAGPGPKNMASDGIIIGSGLVAQTSAALPAGADPVVPTAGDGAPLDIRVYVDYLCPHCGTFEQTNNGQIKEWLNSGAATLAIHPIATLTSMSAGTKYSQRAANAAACVANYSPDQFFAFNDLMFKNQPQELSAGLTNDQIKDLAKKAGAKEQAAINTCIDDQQFKSWVLAATDRVVGKPVPNSNVAQLTGTPTIVVNGAQYIGPLDDPQAFAQFVQEAEGKAFSTATPTPTPSG